MVFNGFVVQQRICKKEEEWRCDEVYDEINSNEEPPEELEDEADLISLKNYCNAEGTTGADMMDVEREIEDMMESIRNLQTTLSENVRVGDMFKVEATGDQERGKGPTEEDSIKASVEEIEKMDAILRVKAAEERKAKLCRIQQEEESKDILSKLPCTRASNVIKENLEEFIRLLNDLGESESDSSVPQSVNRGEGGGDKRKSKEENGKDGEKKAENKNGEERKAKHLKFVEKNIQLAKCGRGTLSLTDEEKQRIEELLQDSGGHSGKSVEGAPKDFYAIDDETKSVLTKIDQQLEAVVKASSAERSGSKTSLLEKHTKDMSEKGEKEKGGDVKKKNKKKKEEEDENRLAEINKLLNAVTSVIHEEIIPLSEEEIEKLLEQSRRSLDEGKDGSSPTEGGVPARGSEDVISELVASAQLLMPKFKYRFVDP